MRLKHIKDSETLIYNSNYVLREPFNFKTKWNKLFNNNNPIEIEIGMGKGNFIISKAKSNPNINYIGIEKYASVILSATNVLKDLELPNLKIICVDAINIEEIFDKEISKLYLNFSDPWPKKRHEKRRLTSKVFLDKYEKIFKNKIIIEMKTDNEFLFDYSLESFEKNNFNITEVNRNYESVYFTEYELKFKNKGKNINFCFIEK